MIPGYKSPPPEILRRRFVFVIRVNTFPLQGGRLKSKSRTAGDGGPYAGIGAIS